MAVQKARHNRCGSGHGSLRQQAAQRPRGIPLPEPTRQGWNWRSATFLQRRLKLPLKRLRTCSMLIARSVTPKNECRVMASEAQRIRQNSLDAGQQISRATVTSTLLLLGPSKRIHIASLLRRTCALPECVDRGVRRCSRSSSPVDIQTLAYNGNCPAMARYT